MATKRTSTTLWGKFKGKLDLEGFERDIKQIHKEWKLPSSTWTDAMIKTYYVPELDTLDVWFGEIGEETESEEVGDGVILKVGRNKQVLGVEIVGLSKTKREDLAGLPSDARRTLLEVIKKLSVATAGLS